MRSAHRRAHRLAWRVLALLLPAILLGGLLLGRGGPDDLAPVQLAPPDPVAPLRPESHGPPR